MSCLGLQNLADVCESLRLLSSIISTSDVSSFELQHSGIITSLIIFLTQEDLDDAKTSVRKAKSVSATPPMVTRRRLKMDSRKPPPVVEIDMNFSNFNDHHPKAAASDETGRSVLENPSSNAAAANLTESGSESDRKLIKSFHPVITLIRDDRIRSFLNVFVGLPVS